jgi:hypothetical protein
VSEIRALKFSILDVANGEASMDVVDDLIYFKNVFTTLLSVIRLKDNKIRQRMQRVDKTVESVSASDLVGQKRSADTLPPQDSKPKRSKLDQTSQQRPKTPDQPTVPAEPDLSGSSRESDDEEDTRVLLNEFLKAVLSIVKTEVRGLKWASSNPVQIIHTYIFCPAPFSNISNKDESRFKLGKASIVGVINDGGLGIHYLIDRKWTLFQPKSYRPVLSLEVLPLAIF